MNTIIEAQIKARKIYLDLFPFIKFQEPFIDEENVVFCCKSEKIRFIRTLSKFAKFVNLVLTDGLDFSVLDSLTDFRNKYGIYHIPNDIFDELLKIIADKDREVKYVFTNDGQKIGVINIQGCEYLNLGTAGLCHKGNCNNPIHIQNQDLNPIINWIPPTK